MAKSIQEMSAKENKECQRCKSTKTEYHLTRIHGKLQGYRVCLSELHCQWRSWLEDVCSTCLGSGREYVDLEHLGHFYQDCHCKKEN